MKQINFLIGNGQLLTDGIPAPRKSFDGKKVIYTFLEAKERLTPRIEEAAIELNTLPQDACPDNYGVISVVLHPAYIAKSYFPTDFLRSANLITIGSKSIKVNPKKRIFKKGKEYEIDTTQLIVAGDRNNITNLSYTINHFTEETQFAIQFSRIEDISYYNPLNRASLNPNRDIDYFEITLHLLPQYNDEFIQSEFIEFCKKYNFKVFNNYSFTVGNLWYVPIYGPFQYLKDIKKFSFIRIIRNISQFRSIQIPVSFHSSATSCSLPIEEPLSSLPRVAILDGGLPKTPSLKKWLNLYKKMDDSAQDVDKGIVHGLGVTSAFLFGPISPDDGAKRPFSYVSHHRIIDNYTKHDKSLDLYRTLGFIEEILLSRQYNFINLSLGPNLPIEDNDIHPWTAIIDDLLQDGNTLMTIAVGNNGENDELSGNNRIQVPADSINALAVGSANAMDDSWIKAPYSAIGPGRRPGVRKPDVIMFGGSPKQYFHRLICGSNTNVMPDQGTSFAAPYLLRNAVGISAILGPELTPLAIKALLIHSATNKADCKKFHCGWGKVPDNLMEIITCNEGIARVVYQGQLCPGKYIRAMLPIPRDGIDGMCKIKATFCYACPVDPQDSCSYTRAALEITFRRDKTKIQPNAQNAVPDPFFKNLEYSTEHDIRSDCSKWENVLHGEKKLKGSTLNSPVFDIHYIARAGGAETSRGKNIPYALILSIEAPKNPSLFSDILHTYPVLTHIQPQLSLPIKI